MTRFPANPRPTNAHNTAQCGKVVLLDLNRFISLTIYVMLASQTDQLWPYYRSNYLVLSVVIVSPNLETRDCGSPPSVSRAVVHFVRNVLGGPLGQPCTLVICGTFHTSL